MDSLRRYLLLLLALSLAGCTGLANRIGGQSPVPAFSALPFPDDKQPSTVNNLQTLGADATEKSAGAVDDWPNLKLPANPGGIEWAVYKFTPSAGETPFSAVVDFKDPFDENANDEAWVAVANFTDGRWDFAQSVNPAAVPANADHLSPNGNAYIAVCSLDTHFAHISSVTLKVKTAGGGWIVASPEPYGQACNSISTAIVDGNPAGAFNSFFEGNLMFARASDADGSNWFDSPAVLVSDPGTNWDIGCASLCIVDGNPAITYIRQNVGVASYRLTYVRALDSHGDTWGTPVDLHRSSDSGTLVVVDGKPAVCFMDWDDVSGNGQLYYIRAADADGTSWDTAQVIDDGESNTLDIGDYSSMAIVNGNPAACNWDHTNNALRYVRASDADGTAWGTPVYADNPSAKVGKWATLVVVNGRPAISYYDETNENVQFVRADDADGTAWGAPVAVAPGTGFGEECRMAIVGGMPAVAYHDYTSGKLTYVPALDADGTSWDAPQVVTSNGSYLSLLEANGHAGIMFWGSNTDFAYLEP